MKNVIHYDTFTLKIPEKHPLSTKPDNPPPEGMGESGTFKFRLGGGGVSVAEVDKEVQALVVFFTGVVDVFSLQILRRSVQGKKKIP